MSEYSSDDGELVQNLQKVVVTHLKKRGTREEVWNGQAGSTSGGLTRADLMISSNGRIVSKKASEKSKALMLDRHQAKKDMQNADEKPSASKSKKSVKVEEETLPVKNKRTPSTVKLAAKNKKKQVVSESDDEAD